MSNNRISRPHFHPRLSPIALGIAASLLLSACGGGGGSSKLSITGSVNIGDYPVSQSNDGWTRVAQWLGFKSVHAQSINEVDTIVAIPTDHGKVDVGVYDLFKSAKLAADGSFDLTLTKEYDWVLLLVNSNPSTPDQKVVAYVTIPASVSVAEDGSLVDLPFSAATSSDIDIGEFSADPTDPHTARSNQDAQSISADVSLSLDDLKKYAQYDDAYRHLVNVYLNYNYSNNNGDFYFPKVEWRWQGLDIDTFDANTTSPQEFELTQTAAVINTNTESLQISDLCENDGYFGLFPPKEVSINQKIYSENSGIMNTNMTTGTDDSGNTNCYNDDEVHIGQLTPKPNAGISTFSFNFPLVDAEGFWKLKAGDKTIALFDFALSSPLDDNGNPLVFVPSIKINKNATQTDQIDSIDIQWWQYKGNGIYNEVKDDAIIDELVSESFINLQDYSSETAASQDINFIQYDHKGLISGKIAIDGQYHWHVGTTPSDPSNGDAHTSNILIGYDQGGISYHFSWEDHTPK